MCSRVVELMISDASGSPGRRAKRRKANDCRKTNDRLDSGKYSANVATRDCEKIAHVVYHGQTSTRDAQRQFVSQTCSARYSLARHHRLTLIRLFFKFQPIPAAPGIMTALSAVHCAREEITDCSAQQQQQQQQQHHLVDIVQQ